MGAGSDIQIGSGSGGSFGPLTGDVTTVGNAATLVGTTNVEAIIAANPTVAAAQTAAQVATAVGVETTRAETAEALLAPLASPALTGAPTAPTASVGTNTTQLATTAFVLANGSGPAGGSAREIAVLTTSTTVVTYTPAAAGNYLISIYFRVITATTNVTVTVTWTDATGAQTLTPLSVVAETVGSYSLVSFMVDSTAAAISVAMTAGTVSQVLGSATIRAA